MGRAKLKPPKGYMYRRKHLKYVKVPAPVELVNLKGKRYKEMPAEGQTVEEAADLAPISLHSYLMQYVFEEVDVIPPAFQGANPTTKRKMGDGYAGNKRTRKLDKAFENAVPGDVVAVEDSDWQVVKKIIEEKNWPGAAISSQFTPLEDAWIEAPSTSS